MVRFQCPAFITLAIWLHWLVISLTPLNQVKFLVLKRVFKESQNDGENDTDWYRTATLPYITVRNRDSSLKWCFDKI